MSAKPPNPTPATNRQSSTEAQTKQKETNKMCKQTLSKQIKQPQQQTQKTNPTTTSPAGGYLF
jgi:hypothetical protein